MTNKSIIKLLKGRTISFTIFYLKNPLLVFSNTFFKNVLRLSIFSLWSSVSTKFNLFQQHTFLYSLCEAYEINANCVCVRLLPWACKNLSRWREGSTGCILEHLNALCVCIIAPLITKVLHHKTHLCLTAKNNFYWHKSHKISIRPMLCKQAYECKKTSIREP